MSAASPSIAVIVLAAGGSSRMGDANKLLEPIDGKALVLHAVDAALDSTAAAVIVVTGHQPAAVTEALENRAAAVVHAAHWRDGLSASLRAGLRAVPEDCAGALVCLGDMPDVTSSLLDKLIAAAGDQPQDVVVVPVREGRRGNPVLWGRNHFTALQAVTGDRGGRDLLKRLGDRVVCVETDDAGIHTDIDTPQALAERRGT